VLYRRATVKFRAAGKTRRWQLAIAIVTALSLFTAVTTGWAARGSMHAQVAAPLPAALSQGTHVGVNVGHAQLSDRSQPTSFLAHGSSPMHEKPNKTAWMTRDRPPTWTRLSPQSVWSPLPASFAPCELALGFQPGADSGAPAAALADQDILGQLCVARR
jgi:hypothetical protein